MITEAIRALPIWGVFIVIAFILLLASESGYRLGCRAREARRERKPADIGTLLGSVLGMLALLLGFTFAMSAARYDARRELVVRDANAIGTAYLRSRLLPEPQRTEIGNLFRRYTDAKLELAGSLGDMDKTAKLLEELEQIQNRMWAAGSEVAATGEKLPLTSIYLQALNEVIDVNGARIAAYRAQIPTSIFMVAVVVAFLAMLLTGYSAGLGDNRNIVATTLACLLVSIVMMLIVDLHRPQDGTITVSQQSIIDTRDWLARQGP